MLISSLPRIILPYFHYPANVIPNSKWAFKHNWLIFLLLSAFLFAFYISLLFFFYSVSLFFSFFCVFPSPFSFFLLTVLSCFHYIRMGMFFFSQHMAMKCPTDSRPTGKTNNIYGKQVKIIWVIEFPESLNWTVCRHMNNLKCYINWTILHHPWLNF